MNSMVGECRNSIKRNLFHWGRRGALSLLLGLPLLGAGAGDLAGVRNVYLLPMGQGLEQYLANQLTVQGVYQVVTDPLKADAIFTDQIGPKFELQMEELYPPEPEESVEPEAAEETKGEEAKGEEAAKKDEPEESEEELTPEVSRISTFSRGKGNVFLIQRDSGSLLWSIYLRPKDSSSEQLNKSAKKIVEQLKAARGSI